MTLSSKDFQQVRQQLSRSSSCSSLRKHFQNGNPDQDGVHILTRRGRQRIEREQPPLQTRRPSSEQIRGTDIESSLCTLTACWNSWNSWVSLILGFLSLSFFSCSVSTRGFATIPWPKVKSVGTSYEANLDEGGEKDDQDGAVVEALVVRPVVLRHHGKGNRSPGENLRQVKKKEGSHLSPPTTMTACQRQLIVSVRSLFSTRHKPQVTISLDGKHFAMHVHVVHVEPCHGDEEEDSEVKVPDVGQGAWVKLGAEDEEEEGLKEDCKQLHCARRQAVGLGAGEKIKRR